jgi:DNA-binding PadR family transcriptional regulator
VSETRDKRRRNDLDLFVLALIDGGVATPYELQRAAGLSPGATIPVLRRLLESGLVLAGKAGARGRTVHKLTALGRRGLKDGWKELIGEGPSGDLDADLRVALLALSIGNNRTLATQFLRLSAAQKRESASMIDTTSERESPSTLAHWYRSLRATAAKTLFKGESTAALAMAKAFPRHNSIKKTTSGNRRKPGNAS